MTTDEQRWEAALAKLPARERRLLELPDECHSCGRLMGCLRHPYAVDGVEWLRCSLCAAGIRRDEP